MFLQNFTLFLRAIGHHRFRFRPWPDYVGNVMETPFNDNEFETACAFQA
jgi:hypothetical protein